MAVFLKITLHLRIFFYQLSIYAYSIGIKIASLWNSKACLWHKGRKLFPKIQLTQPSIWMHCASLGEFEQGRPILEQIIKEHPKTPVIISFFSPSGYEIRKNYEGASQVIYLPIDTPANAKRLIKQINPFLVLWIKNEFWYFYLNELKKRNIPVLLIAANFRSTSFFFKWNKRYWNKLLHFFHHIFLQNKESLTALQSIGITKHISISGDTRFDRVSQIAKNAKAVKGIDNFLKQEVCVVAGSTWQEDEKVLQPFFIKNNAVKLIIAPHEIHTSNLKRLENLFQHATLYSNWMQSDQSEDFQVLIIDNIGLLSSLYQYASVAYVGGAFRKKGLHNILEPIAYGIPVVFGPNYKSFPEAKDCIQKIAGISIHNESSLSNALNELLENSNLKKTMGKNASEYILENQESTNKIMNYLTENRLLTN
jgi:3-deoxy-D-manno-octulosonic-acid transferase